MTPQTVTLLQLFLAQPTNWRYGYDLSQMSGLKSGTLYPILMRLSEHGLLESKWEPSLEDGRPPRHMYRLTGLGARVARESSTARGSKKLVPAMEFGMR